MKYPRTFIANITVLVMGVCMAVLGTLLWIHPYSR